MKKFLLSIAALSLFAAGANAFPKALYVKQGDAITKYSFGVAGDLVFGNNGKTLYISGYDKGIDLTSIDYISFNAISTDALTSSEQKTKLVEIGDELYSYINMNKLSDLFNMIDCFFNHHYDMNGDRVCPPTEFEVPSEYYDVHKKTRALLKTVGEIAKGDIAATRTATNDVVDLYKLEDYYGIYRANYDKEEWEKTGIADYLEIQFPSKTYNTYFVRLEASDTFTTWITKDFEGQIPTQMNLTLGEGEKTIATMVIDWKLVQDESIDMTSKFNCEDYEVVNVMKIENESLINTSLVYANGKEIANAVARLNGKNLLIYDEMKDDIKEATHYHDANGDCNGDDFGPLIAHFTNATGDVDVLGKLQINGKGFKLSHIYDILTDTEDYYEAEVNGITYYTSGKLVDYSGGMMTTVSNNRTNIEKHVDCLNDYTDASLAYDGATNVQAYFTYEVDEYEDTWVTGASEYDFQTGGYVKIGDYIVSAWRDEFYDEEDHEWKWADTFYFYGYKYDDNGNYIDSEVFRVPSKDVIFPTQIKDVWYDIMPLLTFPDLTTYAINDFFDETSFSRLIDDYDDIINTYNKITGQD